MRTLSTEEALPLRPGHAVRFQHWPGVWLVLSTSQEKAAPEQGVGRSEGRSGQLAAFGSNRRTETGS